MPTLLHKLQIVVFIVLSIVALLHFFSAQYVAGTIILFTLVMQFIVTLLTAMASTR